MDIMWPNKLSFSSMFWEIVLNDILEQGYMENRQLDALNERECWFFKYRLYWYYSPY